MAAKTWVRIDEETFRTVDGKAEVVWDGDGWSAWAAAPAAEEMGRHRDLGNYETLEKAQAVAVRGYRIPR